VNDWKVIPAIALSTVLIFGAGVFTGGLLVNYVDKNHPHPAAPRNKPNPQGEARVAVTNQVASAGGTNDVARPRPPEILNKRFLQQLDTDLKLAPAQRDAISKIIDEGQNQMRKAMQDARLEIREVLTPDQQAKFDDLVKRPFHKPIFNTNAPSATPPTNAPAATP
jgi:Spy/CpxP family protein refolding chaperone